MMLDGHIFLASEASTDKRCPDSYLALVDTEHPCYLTLVIEDALVTCIYKHTIFLIWHGDSAFRFHECMFCERSGVDLIHDIIAFGKGFLCVSS